MAKPSLKEAFVAAGLSELHTHGYCAAGVSSIAQQAGGPKGSFYNHFASKEDFAVAVIGRYGEGRRLEMLADESVAPLDRIKAHFAHLQADLEAYDYARGCLLGNLAAEVAGTNRRLAHVVGGGLNTWVAVLAQAIEQARAVGTISLAIDPLSAAGLLVDAWEGAVLRAKALGDPASLDNVLTFAFTQLLVPADLVRTEVPTVPTEED
jgi:TetR/AcrR family transcriptional repressor of nem operon